MDSKDDGRWLSWNKLLQDDASSQERIADLIKDAMSRNGGTFPDKDSFYRTYEVVK